MVGDERGSSVSVTEPSMTTRRMADRVFGVDVTLLLISSLLLVTCQ